MGSWSTEIERYIKASISNQLTETSTQAEQPSHIKVGLRSHQLSLLAAARELESHGNVEVLNCKEPVLLTHHGVIADRVGAGKSLVALSMVRDIAPKHTELVRGSSGAVEVLRMRELGAIPDWQTKWDDLSGSTLLSAIRGDSDSIHLKTALFIVPHNVVPQWEGYIRHQTTLNTVVIKKTKDCDYEDPTFLRNIIKADLVLVSCTMLKKFIGAMCFYTQRFETYVWSRLFIDEADTLRISLRRGEISARFMWFITGSWVNMLFPRGLPSYTVSVFPVSLQGLIGDGAVSGITASYRGLVAETMSDARKPIYTRLVLRNSDTWIDASLLRPAILRENIICRAPATLGILQGHISAAAMEALHAGDTAGAMTALGLKADSKESLVDKVTATLRSELVQAEKIYEFKKTMEYSSPAAKAEGLKKAAVKVERLQEQLVALEERVGKATVEVCPICYDIPQTATLTPCCRNVFCLSCVCTCIAKVPKCPLCRAEIPSVSSLMVIGEESGDPASVAAEELPTKGAALLRLLSGIGPDDRYLVFSAHEASFKGLREMLAIKGVRCELLAGTAARVEKLRTQFRNGKVQVLCMNARHVGAGINLEAATHIVLYHRMNMELEKQVIGRAVRFERAADLRVIHLEHEGETTLNGSQSSEVIVHV
jgi:hypothetical protein